MKMRVFAAIALLLCATLAVASDQPATEQPPSPEEIAAMMAVYEKAATPGEHHEFLQRLAGTFDVRGRMWPAPGQEPAESSGRMEGAMIFDGRYLEQTFAGEFMGMTFQGKSLTAYDNVSGEYVGTWIDTMGTGIMISRGSVDDSGNVLDMTAEWNDPLIGPAVYDERLTIVDDDHHVMEMWGPAPDGTRFKMMELNYTRVK